MGVELFFRLAGPYKYGPDFFMGPIVGFPFLCWVCVIQQRFILFSFLSSFESELTAILRFRHCSRGDTQF